MRIDWSSVVSWLEALICVLVAVTAVVFFVSEHDRFAREREEFVAQSQRFLKGMDETDRQIKEAQRELLRAMRRTTWQYIEERSSARDRLPGAAVTGRGGRGAPDAHAHNGAG